MRTPACLVACYPKRSLVLLALWTCLWLPVQAQTLSIGSRLQGSTLLTDNVGEVSPLGASAGIFAGYQLERARLGFRVELNYQKFSAEPTSWTLPLLADFSPDQRLHLYAGPYARLERLPSAQRWGFMTGLDVHLPLSRRWVLVSGGRLEQDLHGRLRPAESPDLHLEPARALSFSVSMGLAYLLKPRRKDDCSGR
ncbi:MAG: hypothetical protein OHK0039_19750 [Bacteroidia bacterium]